VSLDQDPGQQSLSAGNVGNVPGLREATRDQLGDRDEAPGVTMEAVPAPGPLGSGPAFHRVSVRSPPRQCGMPSMLDMVVVAIISPWA
jgi:hypothetical protein